MIRFVRVLVAYWHLFAGIQRWAAHQRRAERRLGEMIREQKETVGLNTGAAAGGQKEAPRGAYVEPRDSRPTLADAGIVSGAFVGDRAARAWRASGSVVPYRNR